jgi:hypothetical protein
MALCECLPCWHEYITETNSRTLTLHTSTLKMEAECHYLAITLHDFTIQKSTSEQSPTPPLNLFFFVGWD